MNRIVILLLLCISVGCSQGSQRKVNNNQSIVISKSMKHAKGFSVDSIGKGKRLTIYNPHKPSEKLAEFVLRSLEHDKPLKQGEIKVPCKKIVCLSSTQLSYFFEIDDIDNIVAINSSRFLFNKKMKDRIKAGKVKRIGKEGNFNVEVLAGLNPDVIFVSPFKTGGYDAIKNMGIPLVPMAAYSENTPLGRAEWIKMIAPFIGKEQQADSIFRNTEQEYLRLKALTKDVAKRPTVFSGKLKGNAWYVPGGESFFAHLFKDAGADYIIKDKKTGAYPLDYETIYSRAYNTEYWRLLTSSPKGFDKKALSAEDSRYTAFNAFKTGKILVCNLRELPYREMSSVKPHILLADYISHFHPNLMTGYKPKFWRRIN